MKHGVRAVQPDIVVHARHDPSPSLGDGPGPRVGFVVAKSVGNSVDRHRVTRKLRHAIRAVLTELDPQLDPADRIVIRALPGSRSALSARLQQQLRTGVRRARDLMERNR